MGFYLAFFLIEKSLAVKLPTKWIDGKAKVGRVREEKRRRDKIREEKESEDKNVAPKRRKVVKHYVFPMICGPGGSKSRLAKAAGAEPSGAKHMSKSKCAKHLTLGTLLEVEMSKIVEKVHAIVPRSTFPSQNAQNTPFSNHFWKLR